MDNFSLSASTTMSVAGPILWAGESAPIVSISVVIPPEYRDCDTCKNDGDCYVTMLRCKGYEKEI
jgi:hypothetical protein